jgi:hypothetical protein
MSNLPKEYFGDIPADEMKEIMDGMESSRAAEQKDDLFADGDVISVYADAQALEDGFLVDIASLRIAFRGLPVNRISRHLFDDLMPFVQAEAAVFDGEVQKALASILRTKCQCASGDADNTGEVGDIYRIPPALWLVRNEVDGWTAMYPSDY